MRHLAAALFAAGLLLTSPAGRAEEPAPRRALALVDFHYKDTSGEPRNQSVEHDARLKSFNAALQRDLAAGPGFRLVSPSCDPAPCSLAGDNVPQLADAARRAGAELLLVGGIQKMSTLVQWAKVELVDLRSGRVIYDRLYSFRGDNDEAWRRAESFIAGEILALRG